MNNWIPLKSIRSTFFISCGRLHWETRNRDGTRRFILCNFLTHNEMNFPIFIFLLLSFEIKRSTTDLPGDKSFVPTKESTMRKVRTENICSVVIESKYKEEEKLSAFLLLLTWLFCYLSEMISFIVQLIFLRTLSSSSGKLTFHNTIHVLSVERLRWKLSLLWSERWRTQHLRSFSCLFYFIVLVGIEISKQDE